MSYQHLIDVTSYFSNCLGVFQGGGIKGIAYIGAYKKAVEKGINFSEVAGTSVGALFAAFIAIGATPDQIEQLVKEINFEEEIKKLKKKVSFIDIESIFFYLTLFINAIIFLVYKLIWYVIAGIIKIYKLLCRFFKRGKETNKEKKESNNFISSKWFLLKKISFNNYKRFRYHYGYLDSTFFKEKVNEWFAKIYDMKGETLDHEITFDDLKIPLTIFASDISNNQVHSWSSKEEGYKNKSVAEAVAASCAVPLVFTPMHLDNTSYVDGGLLINRPDLASDQLPKYFQTLSFKLDSKPSEIKNIKDYGKSLINTLIYGADHLQHKNIIFRHNEVKINTDGFPSLDSIEELDEIKLNEMIQVGEKAMDEYFSHLNEEIEKDRDLSRVVTPRLKLSDKEQVYNQLVYWTRENPEQVIVSDQSFDWVWSMFPTILTWVINKTKVSLFYDRDYVNQLSENKKIEFKAKKRLIENLIEDINPVDHDRLVQCVITKKEERYNAIVYNKEEDSFTGKVYDDEIDSIFIDRIKQILIGHSSPSHVAAPHLDPSQVKMEIVDDVKIIFDKLRQGVPQYKDARISLQWLPLVDLRFLKNNIRSLKYQEMSQIIELYEQYDIDLFYPAEITLPSGEKSICTPIVVECHDSRNYVIKGNTRCFRAFNEKKGRDVGDGFIKLPVIYVENAEPLDLRDKKIYKIRDLSLSALKGWGDMQIPRDKTRKIDQALRPNDSYLI